MRKVRLLLIVFFLCISTLACGRRFNKELSKSLESIQIADLKPNELQIISMDTRGKNEIVVVTDVRMAFLMKKNAKGEWEIQSIRVGDRQWEDAKLFAGALNQLRAGHVQSDFEKLSAALSQYQVKNNTLPTAQNIVDLTDVLFPTYMKELVRVDPWSTEYHFSVTSKNSYILSSAGPDRKFGTVDDLHFER